MSRDGRCGARGAGLAALSALLTAAGHVAGGGAVPDLALLVPLLPLLAGVFVTAAERSRGFTGSIVALGSGQLALHHLFVLLEPAHHPSAPGGADGRMLLAHVAATLLTAAAVHHADAAVTAVTAALRRVVPRRSPPPAADRPLLTRVVPGPAVLPHLARALAVAHVRRGPPVGC